MKKPNIYKLLLYVFKIRKQDLSCQMKIDIFEINSALMIKQI